MLVIPKFWLFSCLEMTKKMFTFLFCIPLLLILMVKIKVFMKHHPGPLR